MFMESDRRSLPPPTAEELLVVEHVLYQCLHREHATSVDRSRQQVSTCAKCGDWHFVGESYEHAALSPEEIADMWLRQIPRPATHLVVAMQAISEVSRAGWDTKFTETANTAVCILRKGERAVRSRPLASRAEAIVDAVAQIAKNYR